MASKEQALCQDLAESDDCTPTIENVLTTQLCDRVVYLVVTGMTCENCVRKVQDILQSVHGVVNALVDFETKWATVFLNADNHITEDDLISVVQSIGQQYTASVTIPLYETCSILLEIKGMSCATNCARKVQQALSDTEGVMSATVDFQMQRAFVEVDITLQQFDDEVLLKAVQGAGPNFKARFISSFAQTSSSNMMKDIEKKSDESVKESENTCSHTPDDVTIAIDESGERDVANATLLIGGMVCSSCASSVEGVLKCVEGVISVAVSYATEKAVVLYDKSIVDISAFSAAVEQIGYEVTLTSRENKSEVGNATLLIGGMTCNSCTNSVENALKNTEGVMLVTVSFATKKAIICFDKDIVGIRTLVESVEDVGYVASYVPECDAQKALADQRAMEMRRYRTDFIVAILFTLPILLIMLVFENTTRHGHGLMSEALPGLSWEALIVAILATPVQFYSARRFHLDAWRVMKNGVLGMAFLVSMGTNVAYFYGLFTIIRAIFLDDVDIANTDMLMTSSVLIAFVVLGKLLESVAKGKTSAALTKLMELQVKSATLLVFDADGTIIREEQTVPIELVQRGDILKVVRGSSVPTDGVIVYGEGRLDESMLTGESKTIKKVTGDRVLGATVNADGLFHVRVTGVDNDTALSQIIRLVEDAQTSKAPIQAYGDYISSIFVPAVVGLALVTFAVWYSLCAVDAVPERWMPDSDDNFVFALDFGIATLVVACPCALGLATSTAVMVGTGVGAEHGVLVKGGEPLETAHSVNTIIFDKTGTLTVGKPVVTDEYVLSKSMNIEELIVLAGSAELDSGHPLSKAIIDYAKSISSFLKQPTDFHGVSGRGISCTIDEHKVVLGNKAWMADNNLEILDSIELEQTTIIFQNAGKTSIYMGVDGELSAVFAITDAPREEAVHTLKKLDNMGLEVWMVTGDNAQTAYTIAEQLGMSCANVMADVLPSQKSSKVKELQDMGRIVAMVGDGINDSPALAQANLGIAIGGGTEIAVETADMVLMKSNLFDVITALHLSRTIFNRIRMNYVWAFGYNCLLIPLAAGVLYPIGFSIPPMFASAAMALSSVSVVISSLALQLYSPPVLAETNLLLSKDKNLSSPLLAFSTLQERE